MARGALKHVGDGFDAAVRVVGEAADGTFDGIVEGEVVKEQEGIEQVADARRNGTAQFDACAFDGVLRLDNFRDFSWIVDIKLDEMKGMGITNLYRPIEMQVVLAHFTVSDEQISKYR